MKLNIYQVDAFAEELFEGNPAAVLIMDNWPADELMQKIAMENNLAETAFVVAKGEEFDIRWFTPTAEIDLCGHATLASGFVLYNYYGYAKDEIVFNSRSGPLRLSREGKSLLLDFPAWNTTLQEHYPELLTRGLGISNFIEVRKRRDYLVVLSNEEEVRKCRPDFSVLKQLDGMVIITAKGNEVDFVSRFFAPTMGIDEDPVTGSSHSQLIPYWSEKLGKKKMKARQLSARGGSILCEDKGDRVIMGGECVFYLSGEIDV